MFFPRQQDNLIEELKDEIKRVITEEQYEKIDASVIDDFAKMAAYLREVSSKELTQGFKALSDELEQRYRNLGMIKDITNEDGSKSKQFIENPTNVHQHRVFTTVIENWAKQNGLNQGAKVHCIVTEENKQVRKLVDLPGKIPTIFGFLKPPTFRALLSLGYLFKDLGPGKEHGEFTHLLTLYLIHEANKKNRFLTHNPVELYKMLGNELCYKPRGIGVHVSVWDVIFDKVIPVGINNRPDDFNKLIRSTNDPLIQTLSNMLIKRYIKRGLVEVDGVTASGKNAAIKFKDAPGVLLDENIFFSLPYSASQLKAQYDEVANVCHYDSALKDKFPLPKINVNNESLMIDRIIAMFDLSSCQEYKFETSNTKELAKKIHDQLLQIKNQYGENSYVSHSLIAQTLEELLQTKITNTMDEEGEVHRTIEKSPYRTDEYITFLINESKKILLDHDLQDAEQNLIQTPQLAALESELKVSTIR